MDCPVCLKDAKDASPPTYLGLVVECPRCGLYRVTQIAITALRSLKPEERIAALDMAKTVGSRGAPTVTSACLQRFPISKKLKDEPSHLPTTFAADQEAGASGKARGPAPRKMRNRLQS